MEKRKYIKIERISGVSIGSLLGFLYFCDSLDIIEDFYF
jgi:predicted acylesterase/phospholipase RssA